jgi:prefoldin subunit 5
MSRMVKRLITAAVVIIAILAVGIIGGTFSVGDLFNRVSVIEQENEYGGNTLTKTTSNDKTVSWPESYDKKLAPTTDDTGVYYYREARDAEENLVDIYMMYVTERDFESAVEFYVDYYEDIELSKYDAYASIMTSYEGFNVSVMVQELNGQVEIIFNITKK